MATSTIKRMAIDADVVSKEWIPANNDTLLSFISSDANITHLPFSFVKCGYTTISDFPNVSTNEFTGVVIGHNRRLQVFCTEYTTGKTYYRSAFDGSWSTNNWYSINDSSSVNVVASLDALKQVIDDNVSLIGDYTYTSFKFSCSAIFDPFYHGGIWYAQLFKISSNDYSALCFSNFDDHTSIVHIRKKGTAWLIDRFQGNRSKEVSGPSSIDDVKSRILSELDMMATGDFTTYYFWCGFTGNGFVSGSPYQCTLRCISKGSSGSTSYKYASCMFEGAGSNDVVPIYIMYNNGGWVIKKFTIT